MSYVGYCKELPFKAGDIVTIPKGTKVKSTHPKRKDYITKVAVKVKIYHTLPGQSIGDEPVNNPSICWAGSGGYWCEVDINDILERE